MPKSVPAHNVRDALRKLLLSGTVRANAPLVQRDLARRLGTTTTPLREALSRLESEGLVERVAGFQGYRLKKMDAAQIADQGTLRRALECESVRLCAEKASDGELDFIAGLAQQCDAALMSGKLSFERLNRLDLDFHQAIMDAARCPSLAEAFQRLHIARLFCHMISGVERVRVKENHRVIAAQLRKRKTEAAVALMRKHIDRVIAINVRYVLERSNHPGAKHRPRFIQQHPRNHRHARRKQN